MARELVIQGINRKDYEGTDSYGKAYTAEIVGVFDGSTWYSFFDTKGQSRGWKKGDTITVEVTEKTTRDGKVRKDIKLPKAEDTMKTDVAKLKDYMNMVVKVLDEAFPGWRDEAKTAKIETNAPSPIRPDQETWDINALTQAVEDFSKGE